MKKTIITIILFFTGIVTFCGCSEDSGSNPANSDSSKVIIEYYFDSAYNPVLEEPVYGMILNNSIDVVLPYGIRTRSLIASFRFNGTSVRIDDDIQISNVTANDFSNIVTYTVIAPDGSINYYGVSVSEECIRMTEIPSVSSFPAGWPGIAEPVHNISGISGFLAGIYEVTWQEWSVVYKWAKEKGGYIFANSGRRGSSTGGIINSNMQPVTMISWRDAVAWCNAVSEFEGFEPVYYTEQEQKIIFRDSTNNTFLITSDDDGSGVYHAADCVNRNADGYRLLTEAEWEYAARINTELFTAGNYCSGYAGSYLYDPGDYAWNAANSNNTTQPTGQKKPNSYGIFDMSGNVREWCWDWSGFYTDLPPFTDKDTSGPLYGTSKIVRGGGWFDSPENCSTAVRMSMQPGASNIVTGFRVARKL